MDQELQLARLRETLKRRKSVLSSCRRNKRKERRFLESVISHCRKEGFTQESCHSLCRGKKVKEEEESASSLPKSPFSSMTEIEIQVSPNEGFQESCHGDIDTSVRGPLTKGILLISNFDRTPRHLTAWRNPCML